MKSIKEEDVLASIKKLIEGSANYEEDILDLVDVVPDNSPSPTYFKQQTFFSTKQANTVSENSLSNNASLNEVKDLIKAVKQAKKDSHSITLDDLVTNLIKPEILKWLEKNLPSLARELITHEIKKIVHEEN